MIFHYQIHHICGRQLLITVQGADRKTCDDLARAEVDKFNDTHDYLKCGFKFANDCTNEVKVIDQTNESVLDVDFFDPKEM